MKRVLIGAATLIAVLAATSGIGALSSSRASAYASGATTLRALWKADEAKGVPASEFASWDRQLASWEQRWRYAPAWLWSNGQSQLDDLTRMTNQLYTRIQTGDRNSAAASLATLQSFLKNNEQWITVADSAAAKSYAATLASPQTPAKLVSVKTQINGQITTLTKKISDLQASLNADIADRGGVSGVITAATRDLATAQGAGLDTGNVPALLNTVQSQTVGDSPTEAVVQLDHALNQLEARITVNNQIYASLHQQLWNLDAALAEATPNAASLQTQYDSVQASFKAAASDDELATVSGQVTSLQNAIANDLTTGQCGHNVGGGKVITIDLSLQELVFWQDGCAVKATPITTGRPALPTPTGTFHVFYKTTPFHMISTWPKDSPYYYEPTWVSWVMEFAGGGYFIHDAYWESLSDYGPGGQYSGGASHGCVHVPTDTMQWAYSWTPNGTPVVITA
jgi:hypothetical protein